MAGLVPFNRKRGKMLPTGFEGFTNMLDDFFNDNWPYGKSLSNETFKIDIQEKEQEYVVEAQLPGVKKEEINLELNDGRLTISIQREENVDEENKNYIHKESRFCSMSRSVYLADAKQENIKAKLDNGVLRIHVTKDEEAKQSKKIEIE